jgi:hypothetical protein
VGKEPDTHHREVHRLDRRRVAVLGRGNSVMPATIAPAATWGRRWISL